MAARLHSTKHYFGEVCQIPQRNGGGAVITIHELAGNTLVRKVEHYETNGVGALGRMRGRMAELEAAKEYVAGAPTTECQRAGAQ